MNAEETVEREFLAVRYMNDEETSGESGVPLEITTLVVYRICQHSGNCDCSVGEIEVRVGALEFTDGSYYSSDMGEIAAVDLVDFETQVADQWLINNGKM